MRSEGSLAISLVEILPPILITMVDVQPSVLVLSLMLAPASVRKVHQAGGFAALQSTYKVAPHILHARFDLALGLRAARPAQPRAEAPVTREVQKHRVHAISPRSSLPSHTVFIR